MSLVEWGRTLKVDNDQCRFSYKAPESIIKS